MDNATKAFYTEVIYNSVIFAQSAQRFLKVIVLSKKHNKQKTWAVLYHMAYTTLFINLAKVLDDKSSKNIDMDKLIGNRGYDEQQRTELIRKWQAFKDEHRDAIETVINIRSNITARFNQDIRTETDAEQFIHGTEPIQILIGALFTFIENLPWFSEAMREDVPQYADFKNELNFELEAGH